MGVEGERQEEAADKAPQESNGVGGQSHTYPWKEAEGGRGRDGKGEAGPQRDLDTLAPPRYTRVRREADTPGWTLGHTLPSDTRAQWETGWELGLAVT